MILKGFKEKSIKKKFNTILKTQSVTDKDHTVKNVGVIFNIEEVNDFEMFKSLADSLKLLPNAIQVIAYANDEKDAAFSWNTCFHSKDFGWHGKINSVELETFLNTEFDLLISYYCEDILRLKLLTAYSKAKFKASIFQLDKRLNDLIIETKVNEFGAFKSELVKYLKVFNKI
ncbi:DUF6913 domain-containing protein [Hanstruepera marina]|uniref:DUF6913 domain-containing protein n=1 Tax=Hanstruepera marina TaxID=2873265 RepID=UPI001CA70731|nr:hypothetical protein [Hanstruepera marina]